MAFNTGNFSSGLMSQTSLGYTSPSFTDSNTTYQPKTESIYMESVFMESERLEQRWPTFHLYNKLVHAIGGMKDKIIRVPTAIGTPRIGSLTQGVQQTYRTGSGTHGDTAPVPSYTSYAETIHQTKDGVQFATPFTEMPHAGIVQKEAYTNFMLPGPLQQPTWGEAEITAGDVVGANVYLDGDDVQFMKEPNKILRQFAQNGLEALHFKKNFDVTAAILAAGVITSTPGAYGNNEILGTNNQSSGGTGYGRLDLLTPASITGAFAGAYKATPTTDGVQLQHDGTAMTGTRRIQGRNVPTLITGAGVGTAGGAGPITDDELQNLQQFRLQNFRTKQKFEFIVDPLQGLPQIKRIPQVRDHVQNAKALDYNQESDYDLQQTTPYGFNVCACPSLLPLNTSTPKYVGFFAPTSGDKPVRAIVNEEPNVREIKLPFEDPRRPNLLLRFSQQIGVGVIQPDCIAAVYYNAS